MKNKKSLTLVTDQKQTLAEHVNELRRRLTWSALAFLIGGGAGYVWHKPLIALIQKPLHQTLYYTSPAGGFNFVMKICVLTGIFLALPVLIYNLIGFIQPALKKPMVRRQIHQLSILSGVLAAAAIVFAYAVMLPTSLHFFQDFQNVGVKSLIGVDEYLNFVINSMLTFIVVFQLPLILLFIDHIKPLPPSKLLKYEKHVIVGSLALAVVLPFTYDPISQFIIAIPIIVLYNLSIGLIWFMRRQHKKLVTEDIDHLQFDVTPLLDDNVSSQPLPAMPTQRLSSNFTSPTRRLISDMVMAPQKRIPNT